MSWRFALVLGGAWLAGCGPVGFFNQADRRTPVALAAAERHGAAELAPYEYTAAQEYLRQSRLEATRASYQRAIDYARRAEELAARAEGIARAASVRASSPAPVVAPQP